MRNHHQDRDLLGTNTSLALTRLKAIREVTPTARVDSTPLPRTTPTAQAARRRRGIIAGALALSFAVAGGAVVASLRTASDHDAAHQNAAPQLRNVQVVKAHRASGGALVLPATLRPYQATDIYARTSGYLKAWHVDLGDHVTAGQLLAELETPELDQELVQAEAQQKQAAAAVAEAVAERDEATEQLELGKANIARAQAQWELARITHERNKPLADKQAISTQELDESQASLDSRAAEVLAAKAELAKQTANLGTRAAVIHSREATLANSQANVQRLRELKGFQKLVAPFAGVVTKRQAEVGMLVTAGTAGQTALYSLAQQDKLRVQVAVPQSQANQIAVGQSASLVVPEHPSQTFTGQVTRTAASVDSRSRTLNVEIELPNDEQQLLPGAYAEVTFRVSDFEKKLRVPASTLLLKSAGTFVAVIDRDSSIRIVPVRLGRDFGVDVEVTEGLSGNESLVVNPSSDLTSGELVTFAALAAG